jgi:hypothetical protein
MVLFEIYPDFGVFLLAAQRFTQQFTQHRPLT